MAWRGRFHDGVIVVEEGAVLHEGDEVVIEKISSDPADNAAFDELKSKLERASKNADRGEFFTSEQVRAEIDELRHRRRA